MALGGLIRAALDRAGYVLWRREFIRYGVDPVLDVQRLARRWGKPIETVFDVGANVGNASREYLAGFPAAQVHAFEPHPSTFRHLSQVSDPRLHAHNVALGEATGSVTMYEFAEEGGAALRNSLVANATSTVEFGYESRERQVECTTLDAFCAAQGIARVDLLKLDVEGFELAVLHGAAGSLAQVSFVYLEFHDLLPVDGAQGGALMPIAEYLRPFGFRFAATYTDFLEQEGRYFCVANALFVRL